MRTTHPAKRCPLCRLRERATVSDESRRRDVSEDTWSLTPLGAATLARLTRKLATSESSARGWSLSAAVRRQRPV